MSQDAIDAVAEPNFLRIFGCLPANSDDKLGAGCVYLLGPKEPGFWPHVTTAAEFKDGAPDPLDRWSHRVITAMAEEVGGEALFPFGAPVHPFIGWALRSGRAWVSPVGFLVHDTAGLMVSYRGAVFLPGAVETTANFSSPCQSCANRPCLNACPVGALGADGYNIEACRGHLDTKAGQICMSGGCAARVICPISQTYSRIPEQSAFHMRQFHR